MPYYGKRGTEIGSNWDIPRIPQTRHGRIWDDGNSWRTGGWCDVEQHATTKWVATSLTLMSSADGLPEVLVRREEWEQVLREIGIVKISFCSTIVNRKYKIVAT